MAYVKWKLSCGELSTGGFTTFLSFIFFKSAGCVGQLSDEYNKWGTVVDFACKPLHLHMTLNIVMDPTGKTNPYGDLYVDE
jgi:hypothetical protein